MDDGIQVLDTDIPIIEDTPVVDDTTYTPYERINFENGTLVSPGFVDSETGEITMPVYSGKAPVNAQNLNHLEDGIKKLENYVLNHSGSSGDSGGGYSDPVGTVKAYAGSITPGGYLMCDGSQVSKTEYGELFAVLGTAFNLSSDTDLTKFRLPDLRGRVIVGVGSFDSTHSFTLAKTGGEYEHLLTINELPQHQINFGISPNTAVGSSYGLDGTSSIKFSTDPVGGNQSHNNMQPYLALKYIIKAVKTTPLMAGLENNLASNSTEKAPSIYAVNQEFLTKENKGDLIYESSAGSATSITLSKDIAEYKYVEIEACSTILGTTVFLPLQKFKIVNPTDKNFIFLSGIFPNVGGNLMVSIAKGYILKNDTLTVNTVNGYQAGILNFTTNTVAKVTDSEIWITKVFGYK